MPHIWLDQKVAVQEFELVPLFWNKLSSLQKELQRYKEKPFGIKRLQLGGRGRKLLIDFDTLPKNIQEALGDPRKVDHPLETFFKFDPDAVRYYSTFKRAGKDYLDPKEQERYIVNASVMKAVILLEDARTQERIRMGGSLRGISDTLLADVISFQNSLKVLHKKEHTLPTSARFKQLLKEFKTGSDSYYCLIKDPDGIKAQNARKVDDSLEMLLNAIFRNQVHKPTPTEVSRNYDAFLSGYAQVYNEDTGELYDPKDFKSLSQSTIISYINKWENKIATHKSRSGDRQQYMGAFKPHHQLDLPEFAGSLLSIDDRQPPFWYDNNRNRAWFYLGIDVASQCFTAVVHGKSKEGIIVDFYRQIVRNYTQWGICLPYELECESSLNSSFKDTLLRPGAMFDNVRIEANNARGKYIERMFGKVRYDVEKANIGWIARPKAKSEANQASSIPTQVIEYDTLINDRLRDLEKWNNMPHPARPEMSRFDYFMSMQHQQLKPTNWEAILPVLGYKTETSCQVGYVSLQGLKRAIAESGQILTGEALITKMKMIEGRELDVYWLDDNDGNVMKAFAYLRGTNRLICEIMEMPRYNRATLERTEKDEAARILQSAYVASVEAFTRQQQNRIENINIIDNTPKTVNSNFKFPTVRRFEVREETPHVFDDKEEDQFEYEPTTNNSWRTQFLQ
ncbi:hypothetical protein [Flavobacterium caeni]|uniref:Integrase catalytic domain-containing protein n=1 Tax=Flavobacterium caeni TaxID=490189 RepID=A0A1G5K0U7_9FLAO|nr:hypothetical protein [Flavobacterium caeni]SCY94255.1 hypothetical protein SAMN02927903_03016 [Flavobacterium caeni]